MKRSGIRRGTSRLKRSPIRKVSQKQRRKNATRAVSKIIAFAASGRASGELTSGAKQLRSCSRPKKLKHCRRYTTHESTRN